MINYQHPTTKRIFIIYTIVIVISIIIAFFISKIFTVAGSFSKQNSIEIGAAIDSLNGVKVYYNGETDHIQGKNFSSNGYNIGLKWQCVEFVKRYYYEYFNHLMPYAYGNAKDIFDPNLPDASYNERRALVQYRNPSLKKPAINDILVFDGYLTNKYGHIAIVSQVYENKIEIIQQNPGPDSPSREEFKLVLLDERWRILNKRVLGWMRIE